MMILVLACLAFCLLGLGWHAIRLAGRQETPLYSQARGRVGTGILYAYTLGLAPWSKESTRKHPVVYVRGILFHLGILTGMVWLIISLPGMRIPVSSIWFWVLWAPTAVGAVTGWAGLTQRMISRELRSLSIPDDYFAVSLVSVFLTLAALQSWMPGVIPVFQAVAALLLAYIPLGKITHLVYWIYIRFRFGRRYGLRGIIPKPLGFGEENRYER